LHLICETTGALVHARLISTRARAPTPSRTFDVTVAHGVATHKKLSYANPYSVPRAFALRTTHPGLVRFSPEVLELAPAGSSGSTKSMGVSFEPSEAWTRGGPRGAISLRGGRFSGDPETVYVFINDEEDATEECFRVRVFAAEETRELVASRAG
jgi:nephrocystin-4